MLFEFLPILTLHFGSLTGNLHQRDDWDRFKNGSQHIKPGVLISGLKHFFLCRIWIWLTNQTMENWSETGRTRTNWIWIINCWKTAFMLDQVYDWEICEQYSKSDKHFRKLGKRFSSAVTSWTLTGVSHWLVWPKQDDMQADLFFPRNL